jgi:hypothetical protein
VIKIEDIYPAKPLATAFSLQSEQVPGEHCCHELTEILLFRVIPLKIMQAEQNSTDKFPECRFEPRTVLSTRSGFPSPPSKQIAQYLLDLSRKQKRSDPHRIPNQPGIVQ